MTKAGGPGSEDGEEDDEEGEEASPDMPLDALLESTMADKLWSKGSAKHSEGKCRPCHYFHTSTGCLSGRKCRFCHIPHTGRGKTRLGMTKRIQCKRIADTVEEKYQGDPEGFMQGV